LFVVVALATESVNSDGVAKLTHPTRCFTRIVYNKGLVQNNAH